MCVLWSFPVYLCNVYCTEVHVSVLPGPSLPLHPDRCRRFDQACWAACGMPTLSSGTVGTKCWNRWDWSGRLHRERPIPQSEAPPIEGNDPQLGPPAGREEGEVAAGSVKAERMERDERWAWEKEVGCEALKYQRDPGNGWKCWRNKLLSGRVGSILRPFGSFSAPSWEEMRGYVHYFDFLCPSEKSVRDCFTMTSDHVLESNKQHFIIWLCNNDSEYKVRKWLYENIFGVYVFGLTATSLCSLLLTTPVEHDCPCLYVCICPSMYSTQPPSECCVPP